MKYELKIIHNSIISDQLTDFCESDKIDGFTTLSINRSYGNKDGVFKQDMVSGEKYMTFIWFDEKRLKEIKSIKKELEDDGYFIVLSKLNEEL